VSEEKKRNPNFVYIFSRELQMEVAVSKKTGEVTCADGVKYSPAEIDVYERTGGIITLAEHRVKKIIGGEIVEYKGTGADKPPAVQQGELEIF
jgi:hypothetical protein